MARPTAFFQRVEDHLRDNHNARLLWEQGSIPGTRVSRMAAFNARGRVVILQQYRDGGGEIYVPISDLNNIEQNLEALDNRLSDDPPSTRVIREFLEACGRTVNAMHNAQLPDGSHPARRWAAEIIAAAEPLHQLVKGESNAET